MKSHIENARDLSVSLRNELHAAYVAGAPVEAVAVTALLIDARDLQRRIAELDEALKVKP